MSLSYVTQMENWLSMTRVSLHSYPLHASLQIVVPR